MTPHRSIRKRRSTAGSGLTKPTRSRLTRAMRSSGPFGLGGRSRGSRLERLEPRQMLAATSFAGAILADVNAQPASSVPAAIGNDFAVNPLGTDNDFVTVGSEAYFAAQDHVHGTELYETDGSTVTLVKDIVPGTESSSPTNLTDVNGTLYFTVTSPTGAESLWTSDGTGAGTKILGALPGATSVSDLTVVGNNLFFVDATALGPQLWVSDGTAPQFVHQFGPLESISSLVSFNQKLYFADNEGGATPVGKLGTSDGTGVAFVNTPTPFPYHSIGQLQTVTTTSAAGGTQSLYFAGDNDLWQYDGTSPPTVAFLDSYSPVGGLTAVGGTLFFVPGDTGNLWSTTPSTTPVEITPPAAGDNNIVLSVVDAGGTLYFTQSVAGALELFAITQADTASASAPIDQKQRASAFSALTPGETINQQIFFVGGDNGLWVADGAPGDTAEIKMSNAAPVLFAGATAVNNKLVFFASATSDGSNVWETNGTNATELPPIASGTEDSTPSLVSGVAPFGPAPTAINVGGAVYFTANRPELGPPIPLDLYKTDGSEAGTVLVKSGALPESVAVGLSQIMWNMNGNLVYVDAGLTAINAAGVSVQLFPGLAAVSGVLQVGTTWYFIGSAAGGVTQLYSTDGTPSGTKLVAGANVPASVFSEGLATLGDNQTVYFLAPAPAPAPTGDAEIFAYNGTTATPIQDVGANDASTTLFTSGANLIVTSAPGGVQSLWISDGTQGGTQQVSFGAAPPPLIDSGSVLPVTGGYVFGGTVSDALGVHDELWKVDTTTSPPTASVLSPLGFNGTGYAVLSNFEQVGQYVTFNVNSTTGTQLWTTDGTANGTTLLHSFSGAGFNGSAPSGFTLFNGKLYFAADDGTNGSQLWATDGTSQNTAAVTNINANESTGGFDPTNLTVVGNQLWMSGNDGTNGDQPWVSDGTAAGTTLAAVLTPGGSGPSGFTAFNNSSGQIFLRATDPMHGSEPWEMRLASVQPLVATAAGNFTATAGANFSHVVATFTDPNSPAAAASYSATVSWGDGPADTNATISGPDSNGTFTVTDSHTYPVANSGLTVMVTVHRGGFPDSNSVSETVNVSTQLVVALATLTAVEGLSQAFPLATFTDSLGSQPLSDYTATITWLDDNTTSNASITFNSGVFTVVGVHTFSELGSLAAAVTIDRVGLPTVGGSARIAVSPPQPLNARTMGALTATGASFNGALATFTDPNGAAAVSSYSATVSWGDGQTDTNATISGPDGSGTFTVTDSHTYAQKSTNTVTVTVHRSGFPDSNAVTDTVTIITSGGGGKLSATEAIDVIGFSTTGASTVPAPGLLADVTGSGTLSIVPGTATGQNGGTFQFNADGSFTYTPPASFNGFDHATYTATDGAGDKVSATVTVLSHTAAVAWKFYESMLDRDAEDQGLSFWISQFNSGVPTSQIAVSFFAGNELQTRVITDYYLQYLGRQPDTDGLNYWMAQWTAAGGPEDVQAGFANSPEFTAQNGNAPSGWVTGLYEKILNRAPEAQGLAYWIGQVQQLSLQDGMSFLDDQQARFVIADRILKSQERYQDIIVPGWFAQFVQRQPSANELTQYVNELLGGTPDRTVEEEIIDQAGAAADVPSPALGTAVSLPDFDYVPLVEQNQASVSAAVSSDALAGANAGSSPGQAGVAAKDALFANLGT
jgi:ELWxxDGT repeat protein